MKTAYATQKKWVGLVCDECGARYACLVGGVGHISDGLIPFSEDTLKEVAVNNLDLALQKKAESVPCPQCGSYPENHVERSRALAARLIVWGCSILIFALGTGLLAMLAPKAPSWVLLCVIALAMILPRLFCGPVVCALSPNRDLERNIRIARIKESQGLLRMQAGGQNERS